MLCRAVLCWGVLGSDAVHAVLCLGGAGTGGRTGGQGILFALRWKWLPINRTLALQLSRVPAILSLCCPADPPGVDGEAGSAAGSAAPQQAALAAGG